MAPWIASVGADNAIELRHHELHHHTYWHTEPTSFRVSDWKLQLQINIAQWNTMYLPGFREAEMKCRELFSTCLDTQWDMRINLVTPQTEHMEGLERSNRSCNSTRNGT